MVMQWFEPEYGTSETSSLKLHMIMNYLYSGMMTIHCSSLQSAAALYIVTGDIYTTPRISLN
jgi:hypothetical protein